MSHHPGAEQAAAVQPADPVIEGENDLRRHRVTGSPAVEVDTRQMRLVAGIAVGQADDEHVGFGLDDAGDEVLEGVHQHGLDRRAGWGRDAPELLLEHAVIRTEPSLRTARFSRKYFSGKYATGVRVTAGTGVIGMDILTFASAAGISTGTPEPECRRRSAGRRRRGSADQKSMSARPRVPNASSGLVVDSLIDAAIG